MEQNTWNKKSELSKISTHVASSPVCFDISHYQVVRVQHILRHQNRAGSPFLRSPPLLRISLPGCLAGGWGLCSCQCLCCRSRWGGWTRIARHTVLQLWSALLKSSFSWPCEFEMVSLGAKVAEKEPVHPTSWQRYLPWSAPDRVFASPAISTASYTTYSLCRACE